MEILKNIGIKNMVLTNYSHQVNVAFLEGQKQHVNSLCFLLDCIKDEHCFDLLLEMVDVNHHSQ